MQRTINVNDVSAFLAVVETQSFTKAAERLGLAKSAVSRRVRDLEDGLGVRLLHRTTRRLQLSEAGSAYAARAARALESLSEANDAARDLQDATRGTVRLTAPVDLGSVLAPVLVRFMAAHHEIRVEVILVARRVDLVAEGVDLALRFGPLADSTLVARKIVTGSGALVASPAYLASRGAPRRLVDLGSHEAVFFRGTSGRQHWELEGPKGKESVEVKGRLVGDDLIFVRQAVLDGAGIALMPWFLVADHVESGALVHVLPRYVRPAMDGHLVYPSARLLPRRVSLLATHLLDQLSILKRSPKESR